MIVFEVYKPKYYITFHTKKTPRIKPKKKITI